VAGLALLALLVAQWMLSAAIHGTNYDGGDGKMAQAMILAALKFTKVFDVTALSPIEGMGSQLVPVNVWGNPAHWPFAFLDKEVATDVSALIALAVFATACYVMTRCFTISVVPSVIAAQLSIALFAPTVMVLQLSTIFCINPDDAVVFAPHLVALGLLARLERCTWRAFALTAGAIFAMLLYSLYCDPLWSLVSGFSWALPFAVVTFSSRRRGTILVRLAALACCVGLLLVTGVLEYVYTLSQYTARVQFATVLDRPRVEFAILHNNHSGGQKPKSVGKLQVVGALQSIGRRDRCEGNANVERRQHDQGMINAVCSQNGQRPLRTKLEPQQTFG